MEVGGGDDDGDSVCCVLVLVLSLKVIFSGKGYFVLGLNRAVVL
jgi:hypothetical protein